MTEPASAFGVHLGAVLRLGARGNLDAPGADRAVAWLLSDLALLASHPTNPGFELADGLLVSGKPARLPPPLAKEIAAFGAVLESHGVGGARLRAGPDRDAVSALVRGPRAVPPDFGRDALQRWLDLNGGRAFELLPVRPPPTDAEAPRSAPEALKTYGRFWYAVAKARAARTLAKVPVEVRRAMRSQVELAQGEPRHHLALAALTDDEDAATRHAVHAALFAIALGLRLGLGRGALLELGLCALLAAELPDDDGTAAAVADQLVRTEPDAFLARRMLTTWEHRVGVDRASLPPGRGQPHLFARIAAIAVDYDTLVTGAGRVRLLPDEALGRMQAQAGRRYDKALLALFAEMLGPYPLGTAVLLDTHEVGVVYRSGGGHRPVVRLVVDKRAAVLRGGPLVDLAVGGRRIVGTVDPATIGIDPADALFG